MIFGPSKYYVFEEVGIEGLKGNLPKGFLDIIGYEEKREGAMNVVAFSNLDVAADRKGAVTEMQKKCNTFSTTAKSEVTYEDPGSDRQLLVELLALSSVLSTSPEGTKSVVTLKATTSKYKPYVYFPADDILIRVATDLPFDVSMKKDSHDRIGMAMFGSFVFYLLLHYAINPFVVEKIKQLVETGHEKCGWKLAFEESGVAYHSSLKLQKYPKKRSNAEMIAEDPSGATQLKVSRFPSLDFFSLNRLFLLCMNFYNTVYFIERNKTFALWFCYCI